MISLGLISVALAKPEAVWKPKFGECNTSCASDDIHDRGYLTFKWWQCMAGDSEVDEKHCIHEYPAAPVISPESAEEMALPMCEEVLPPCAVWKPKFGECNTSCASDDIHERGYLTFKGWYCMAGDSEVDEKFCQIEPPPAPVSSPESAEEMALPKCKEVLSPCPCTVIHDNVEPIMKVLDTEALQRDENGQLKQVIPWTGQPISVKCNDGQNTVEMKCDNKGRLKARKMHQDKPLCGKYWDSEIKELTEGCTSFAEGVDHDVYEISDFSFDTGKTHEMKWLGWSKYVSCRYGPFAERVNMQCETRQDATGKDVTALYQKRAKWEKDVTCNPPSCSYERLSDIQFDHVDQKHLERLRKEWYDEYRNFGDTEELQCENNESKMLLKCQGDGEYKGSFIAVEDAEGYVNVCPETQNEKKEDRLLRV